MKKSNFFFVLFLILLSLPSGIIAHLPSLNIVKEPCNANILCYEIMQSKNVNNWDSYFEDIIALPKDTVDICLVDSILRTFFKDYNKKITKDFEGYYDEENLIEHFSINVNDYCFQIIPYGYEGKLELLLSCIEKKRVSNIGYWRQNYFGILHERGMSHFYMTIDQKEKKVISFEP